MNYQIQDTPMFYKKNYINLVVSYILDKVHPKVGLIIFGVSFSLVK